MFTRLRSVLRQIARLNARELIACGKIALRERSLGLRLRLNAIRHPLRPTRGITLVGHFGAKDSLGKVARDLALGLRETGLPFQTFSLDENVIDGFADVLTPRGEFRARKYDHVLDVFGSPFPALKGIRRGSVFFWEFESGFAEAHALHMDSNAVAMSDFNYSYFKKIFPPPRSVSKILYPFRLAVGDLPGRSEIRARFGIGAEAVVVFFNFDFGSSVGRKNPDGLMRAFARAARDIPGAILVFKTMRDTPAAVEGLWRRAGELGIADRFVLIREYLSTRDLYGLTAASDVYASLHRGEGFGLGIAEAMSLGVPVLVTAYSAPLEFCRADTAALVPFRLVAPERSQLSHACYNDVTAWAEPDADAAADKLHRLLSDADYRRELGESARLSMSRYFSADRFRNSVQEYLDA